MPKKKLFISYSHVDITKVNIIKKVLLNNTSFEAIIIAFNREALKPLSSKVIEGIKSADCIIPILTSESIKTQWINQEIGYATALNKLIIPVVEIDCIDQLKGFIHKQIDLPYTYCLKSHKATENKGFKKQFAQLIDDLQTMVTANIQQKTSDPIDNQRKGPQGQTLYISPRGGRYYTNVLGYKTYININQS
jgi:hypothetical protein